MYIKTRLACMHFYLLSLNLSKHFMKWGTLYVQIAGKMICKTICENLRSKYDINSTPDMKIRNLTIKFISRYSNMTYRYQLEQPRPMIESKVVKHIKNMSEEEQDNYNFLVCKHKLSLL